MATVKQCDRCGAVYGTRDDMLHGSRISFGARSMEGRKDMDLCPECTDELARWACSRPRIERHEKGEAKR